MQCLFTFLLSRRIFLFWGDRVRSCFLYLIPVVVMRAKQNASVLWPQSGHLCQTGPVVTPCCPGLPYDSFFFFFNLFILFIYSWLHWVFVAARGLSLVAGSGGYSSLQCTGFSLQWLPSLWSTGSRRAGFSSCGMWAQQLWLTGSRAQAQQLWRTGLAAPRHVGSSRTRDRTRVPCIGRRILNHCATREALMIHSWLAM